MHSESSHTNLESAVDAKGDSGKPLVTKPELYSRRRVIAVGAILGAGIATAVVLGETTRGAPAHTGAVALPSRSFKSTRLKAQAMITEQTGETAPGYLFIEPETTIFNGMIVDNGGEAVWIDPSGASMTDVAVQTFEGKPVLTYWSGNVAGGHGKGVGNILDASYRTIAVVKTGPGMDADLHEFHLTPWGTALMTAYPTEKADLSSVGGPASGYLLNGHIQEVDIRTGAVLLSWSALDHVPVAETYADVKDPGDGLGKTPTTGFDAYHLNSIDYDKDGTTLYISGRHTHTIYAIDRKTGAVKWRMGGKKSDFAIDKNAQFAWQHHVRKRTDGIFTVFNNHSRTSTDPVTSSGLLLNVDEASRTVSLQRSFDHGILSTAQGSVQPLENGNVLIGWGGNPVITEYTGDGKLVYKATHVGSASYRSFRHEWVAHPTTKPVIAVETKGAMSKVYVSWNGATEVRKWRIMTGKDAGSLTQAVIVARSGFETVATVPRSSVIAVQALDESGSIIGRSKAVLSA
ncbi:MAG TPA: arylsulfotransferase family protein [Galbitalea sp.]|jgi:hypothetical protein|nr:arylsulfotransferase family protein [Galbitalea sp.]